MERLKKIVDTAMKTLDAVIDISKNVKELTVLVKENQQVLNFLAERQEDLIEQFNAAMSVSHEEDYNEKPDLLN